jgi:hypothetical protein
MPSSTDVPEGVRQRKYVKGQVNCFRLIHLLPKQNKTKNSKKIRTAQEV